jgi:hypothetical protein
MAKGEKLVRMRRAVYPRDMTLREAKLAMGWELGGFMPRKPVPAGQWDAAEAAIRAEETRREEKLIGRAADEPWWICGEFPASDACASEGCIYFSEYLCDYPIGRGKTCDRSMCPGCAHQIGEDTHYCADHARAFADKCGANDNAIGLRVVPR